MQGFEQPEVRDAGPAFVDARQVRIRHHPRDGSVFLDNDYLVRGW